MFINILIYRYIDIYTLFCVGHTCYCVQILKYKKKEKIELFKINNKKQINLEKKSLTCTDFPYQFP